MDPMTWIQIAILVIGLIYSARAMKKNSAKPASLQDFQVPTAQEGRPVAMVFGDVWISDPNFLDYGNLRTTPIKASGGK